MTKPQNGSFNAGMGDRKGMDAFVARMAAGKAAAKARGHSQAPPIPKVKAKPATGAALNAVKAPATKLPEPKAPSGSMRELHVHFHMGDED